MDKENCGRPGMDGAVEPFILIPSFRLADDEPRPAPGSSAYKDGSIAHDAALIVYS